MITRRNLIAGLTSLAFVRLLPAKAKTQFEPFSFVHVCDTHLTTGQPDSGYKLLQESQLFLQESIKAINGLNPDFVIFGGDQVEQPGINDANWQLFVDLVQGLNAPWSFVLGEQDASGRIIPDKMRCYGPDWKGKGITTNTSYWSLSPVANVLFIGLDSSVPNSNTGEIGHTQLDWLKAELEANKGKFTIIFCHHPLLPPPPYDGGPPWDEFILSNGADVREIIGVYEDVKMVVNGHLYLNKVQQERHIYHVSCAAMDIYPCQFKLFKVSPDSISMESITVNFPALVKKGYKSMVSSNLAFKYDQRRPNRIIDLVEGSKEDQNCTLSLGNTGSILPAQPKKKKALRKSKEKTEHKK